MSAGDSATGSEGPLVVKIGGTALEEPRTSAALWDAIAALAARHNGKLAIVHGGGKAVDRLLDRLGMPVERVQGLRVTPEDQIEYITGVLAGSLNKLIVGQLIRRRVRAVGVCLGDGGALTVMKKSSTPDLGLVGEVLPIDPDDNDPLLLRLLLWGGFVPAISSIGIDHLGRLLNVNADDAAAGVARQLGARMLVLMTDVPGILDASKAVIPEIDEAGIERLIGSGVISGGMIPKARSALYAAIRLKAPVLILPGNDPAALSQWCEGHPIGTRVVQRLQR